MRDTLRLRVKALRHGWAGLILSFPGLAFAHGDDEVKAATFIGPMLALAVILTVVGLGKALLRAIVKRS